MSTNITIGLKTESNKIVKTTDSAKSYGSGLVDVFSTPALIAFIEQTCNELILPYLQENEVSVGIEVNVKHLKATPIGDKVTCTSEVFETQKNKITFRVEAHDSKGKISEGTHKRAIVNKDIFMKNL